MEEANILLPCVIEDISTVFIRTIVLSVFIREVRFVVIPEAVLTTEAERVTVRLYFVCIAFSS